EVSEPEIVRHYNRISRRNFDLDTGFYPLGSFKMKHNPKVNERVAALPGHARLHPLTPPERAQGALELMWLLQRSLAEVCGLAEVSLQPSAAAPRGPPPPGRRARGVGRSLAHPRLPRGPRRVARQGADPGHRARHESRDGH